MKGLRQSSYSGRLFEALFATVFGAGTILMGLAYAKTDGGAWLGGVWGKLVDQRVLFTLLFGVSVFAGSAIALFSTAGSRSRIIGGLAATAAAALLIGASGFVGKLTSGLEAADWVRITYFLVAGAGWGAGWAGACAYVRRQAPVWGFALPFGLAGLAVTVLSRSIGGGVALVWLLIFGPALGSWVWRGLGRIGFVGRVVGGYSSSEPNERIGGNPLHLQFFALGVAALALLGFVFGLAHLAYPIVFLGVLGVLSVLLFRPALPAVKSAREYCSRPFKISLAGSMLLGVLGAVLVAQWISALAPETGPDAVGARTALPAIWLRHGEILAQPAILLSYMGFLGESLFLFLMPLAGYSVAKIVAFACLLPILGAILKEGSWRSNPWAVAAAALFASSTIVWWQLFHGFVDLFQALFILGAAESIRRWLRRPDERHLIVAGLLAGAAAAIKLNGIMAMAAVAAAPFIAILWRRRGLGAAIKAALWAALPGMLVLGPFLVRSAFLTGNPVFPLANGLFKSPLAPESLFAPQRYGPPYSAHYGLPFDFSTWQVVYKVFFQPQKFAEIGTYHPLLLPLLAGCGVVAAMSRRVAWFWIGAFLISAGLWAMTEQNLRYSLVVGLFAVLAIASITAGLSRIGGVWSRSLAAALLVVVVIAGLTLQLARPLFWAESVSDSILLPLQWAVGRQTSDAFLRIRQPTYPLAVVLNRTAGRDARLWELPYLRDQLYFNCAVVTWQQGDKRMLEPFYRLPPFEPGNMSPAGIAATLRANGITHLLFNDASPWQTGIPESMWGGVYSPAFTSAWLEPMAGSQDLRLYRLRATPASHEPSSISLGQIPLVSGAKTFRVNDGKLYEMRLAQTLPATTADDYVFFVWYNGLGKPILYQYKPFPPGPAGAWHRWLESAPPGAARLDLIVHTKQADPTDEIEVRELRHD